MMLGYVTHVKLCYITHDYVMLYNTWYVCYITHDMYMLYNTWFVMLYNRWCYVM